MAGVDEQYKIRLIKLSWPIFIETLLYMLLGSVDTFMLSRYSDNAVGAVGVSNQLVTFINLTFAIITTGTAILCSQYVGAKDYKEVSRVSIVSLVLNALLGILLSIVLVLSSETFLRVMNISDELMGFAKSYLEIVGFASVAQAVVLTTSAIVRSRGFTKITMYITIGVNILNILGNYILIFGKFGFPAMGVAGAAISTTISKFVALAISLIILFKCIDKDLSFKLIKPFPKNILKNLLKIGIPSAGEQIAYNTSQIVITYFINIIGIKALTTKAYVSNVAMIALVFSVSIAQGTSILVGNLVGNNKKEEAYSLCFYSLKVAMILELGLAIIIFIFSKQLLGIFTHDTAIIELGRMILLVDIVLELGRVINIVVINSLRASGDVKFPVYCGIASMWGIAVVFSYVLGIKLELGLIGVWIAFAMDECIRGVLMIFRWKSKKWETMSFVNNGKESKDTENTINLQA